MSQDETVDVLMGGYLSKDAAQEDFNAVQASRRHLHRAGRRRARTSTAPWPSSSRTTRQGGRQGARRGRLHRRPLRAAAPRRDRGRRGHRRRRRQDRPQEDREPGSRRRPRRPSRSAAPALIVVYDPSLARGHRGGRHAGHQAQQRRGDRPAQDRVEGGDGRRAGEDERASRLTPASRHGRSEQPSRVG